MRTFDKTRRLLLAQEDERDMFQRELEYYTVHNCYPVVLFGKRITNIYKRVNVQVLITTACANKCAFCIEHTDDQFAGSGEAMLKTLDSLMQQYDEQGVSPCVSITGGEPALFPDLVRRVVDTCRKRPLSAFSINSSSAQLTGYGAGGQCVTT